MGVAARIREILGVPPKDFEDDLDEYQDDPDDEGKTHVVAVLVTVHNTADKDDAEWAVRDLLEGNDDLEYEINAVAQVE